MPRVQITVMLTEPQARALLALDDHGGKATVREVGCKLGVDYSLVDKNLLRHGPAKWDWHEREVTITDEGKQAVRQLRKER
jgi:DNA-binding MarR family transcriptional regulator